MSLTTAVTIRQVKEVYVVAQWMKIGLASLTIDNYAKRLSDIRSKVERLSASSLDHAVVYENGVRRHHDRLKRLEESSFQVRVVSLDSCSVWKEMGERKWASGLVSTVAKRFLIHGEVGDPLHVMMNFASQGLFEALPIIVYS